jgi:hypothetical protein
MDGPSETPEALSRWPRPGADALTHALIAPAPAALLAFWGMLIYVFGTQPIRPYTDGAWAPGDLTSFVVLGAVIGLVCRPLSAAAGIILGAAAAVALQLFVLAGQAHYQAVVVAALTEPAWTRATTGALALSIGALVLGSLASWFLVTVGRRASRQPRSLAGSQVDRPDRKVVARWTAAGLVVLAIAGLMVGISLVTTAHSAYLPTDSEPIIEVQLVDDKTLNLEPGSAPAGRMTIETSGPGRLGDLALYGPLTPEEVAWLADGRVNTHGREVYWNHRLRRTELAQPGLYAFVALDPEWVYPQDEAAWTAWDGSKPVTAVHLFRATAAEPSAGLSTEAGGDGGAHLTLPAAAALATEGWAAAGALLLAIRRYRRPTTAHVVVAAGAGLLSVGFVGMLTALAIGQAHSPF